MSRRTLSSFALGLMALLAAGCVKQGSVCEGRCIRYDPAKRTVTLIADATRGATRFDQLPPITFQAPDDPGQMGPAPEAGLLLGVSTPTKELRVFNPESGRIETVKCLSLEVSKERQRSGRQFPEIDLHKQRVTLLLQNPSRLLDCSLSAQDLARPVESWTMGDIVRIYYQEPGKALRLMNVSQTRELNLTQ